MEETVGETSKVEMTNLFSYSTPFSNKLIININNVKVVREPRIYKL